MVLSSVMNVYIVKFIYTVHRRRSHQDPSVFSFWNSSCPLLFPFVSFLLRLCIKVWADPLVFTLQASHPSLPFFSRLQVSSFFVLKEGPSQESTSMKWRRELAEDSKRRAEMFIKFFIEKFVKSRWKFCCRAMANVDVWWGSDRRSDLLFFSRFYSSFFQLIGQSSARARRTSRLGKQPYFSLRVISIPCNIHCLHLMMAHHNRHNRP